MTGSRVVVGLSLLCAFAFCAIAAPSAMAAKSGTGYFTCIPVKAGTGDWANGHCTKTQVNGNFGHQVIKNAEKTRVTLSNKRTKVEGGEEESPLITLSGEAAGAKLELTATGFMSSEVPESYIENTEVGEAMTGKGGGAGTYTGVKILKPEKCAVAGEEVKQLESVSETKEMEVEFKPKTGTTFAEFEIINKGEEKCPLNKTVIKVTGDARGIPEGGFLGFTEASTKGSKCGEAGTKGLCIGPKPAFFVCNLTVRMGITKKEGEEGKVEGNPITATTTT